MFKDTILQSENVDVGSPTPTKAQLESELDLCQIRPRPVLVDDDDANTIDLGAYSCHVNFEWGDDPNVVIRKVRCVCCDTNALPQVPTVCGTRGPKISA
jgi:hypothetical protein